MKIALLARSPCGCNSALLFLSFFHALSRSLSRTNETGDNRDNYHEQQQAPARRFFQSPCAFGCLELRIQIKAVRDHCRSEFIV
jgi:hypothetical protein